MRRNVTPPVYIFSSSRGLLEGALPTVLPFGTVLCVCAPLCVDGFTPLNLFPRIVEIDYLEFVWDDVGCGNRVTTRAFHGS